VTTHRRGAPSRGPGFHSVSAKIAILSLGIAFAWTSAAEWLTERLRRVIARGTAIALEASFAQVPWRVQALQTLGHEAARSIRGSKQAKRMTTSGLTV
jgi:hypothetical protein